MADEQKSRAPWPLIIAVGLVTVYALLFVILNTRRVQVSFVLFSTRVSVIWVILLSLAAGIALGLLGSQLHRRRQRGR